MYSCESEERLTMSVTLMLKSTARHGRGLEREIELLIAAILASHNFTVVYVYLKPLDQARSRISQAIISFATTRGPFSAIMYFLLLSVTQ